MDRIETGLANTDEKKFETPFFNECLLKTQSKNNPFLLTIWAITDSLTLVVTVNKIFRANSVFRKFICSCLLSLLIGCQYTFEGGNPPLPAEAATLSIAPIENQTFESDLETFVMQALSSRLRGNSAVRLRGGSERSDLLLRVRLVQMTRMNLDEPEALAVAQQLTLTGTAILEDQRTNKQLWEVSNFRVEVSTSSNDSSSNADLSGQRLSRGIQELTENFAEKIYSHTFYTF